MSVKVIQPEFIHDQNYLTLQNGCQLKQCSSEDPRALATNILTNQKKVWMTSEPLPQHCIISMRDINNVPQCFNIIGFYCWHQFDTNPSLIQVYSRQSSENWKLVGKFRLKHIDGWQYFSIQEIQPRKFRELKVQICKSYGSSNAYLNQIALHSANLSSYIPTVRQSRSSTLQEKNQYLTTPIDTKQKDTVPLSRLNSTQHKLMVANQKIAKLTEQQNEMKSTIIRQGNVILQLEQKMKLVIGQMQKLYEMQMMESNKSKKMPHSYQKYEEYQSDEDFEEMDGNQKMQKNQQKLKKMLDQFDQEVETKQRFMKKPEKIHKYHTVQTKKARSKRTDNFPKIPENEVIHISSEENFSEYSHGLYRNQEALRSKSKADSVTKNKEELLQKIKLLLKLKEQKKSQLSSKKSRQRHQPGQWSANQSVSPGNEGIRVKSSMVNENIDDSVDDEYFAQLKKRKIRAYGY